MKNVGLTLSEALRYMFAGLVPFGLLYCVEPDWAERLLKNTGGLGLGLLALGWGSVAYFTYRALVYDLWIVRLQDWKRFKPKGYRAFLISKYDIKSNEAQMLWRYVRDRVFPAHTSEKAGLLETQASGIHLLYMSGIQALIFSVWRALIHNWGQAWPMLILALILLYAGFRYDRLYEEFEGKLLRSFNEEELDTQARKLGFTRGTSHNE